LKKFVAAIVVVTFALAAFYFALQALFAAALDGKTLAAVVCALDATAFAAAAALFVQVFRDRPAGRPLVAVALLAASAAAALTALEHGGNLWANRIEVAAAGVAFAAWLLADRKLRRKKTLPPSAPRGEG
jgi:hypothetical protein